MIPSNKHVAYQPLWYTLLVSICKQATTQLANLIVVLSRDFLPLVCLFSGLDKTELPPLLYLYSVVIIILQCVVEVICFCG